MRARAIDWLRGLAALVMVQTHALVLVQPALREGPASKLMGVIDGTVAPAFYFCAGFALAYTLVGAGKKNAVAKRARRIFFRSLQVLAVAAWLTWQWFPIFDEPKWLLRIDVLSCIGLSLLVLLVISAPLAKFPRTLGLLMLALASAIFAFAPAMSRMHGPLAPFIGISTGSVFPLVPWGGHLAFGAAGGALIACGFKSIRVWGVLAIWAVVSRIVTGHFAAAFGEHDPWSEPAGQWQRVCVVMAVTLLFALVELRVGDAKPSVPRRVLEWYGTTSLWLYALHEVWLYMPKFGFCFNDHWGNRLTWPQYVGATLLLILAATVTVGGVELVSWCWDRAKQMGLEIVRGQKA